MEKAKHQAATMGAPSNAVEQAFYEALHHADIQQRMAYWAEESKIVCVHPDGPRLTGSAAIRQAFERIFRNRSAQVHAQRIRKIESLASATHHLIEKLKVLTALGAQSVWELATTVRHKTSQCWCMVAHHSSTGTADEMADQGLRAPLLL